MALTTTNSAGGKYRALSGTLQEVLDGLDAHKLTRVSHIYWNGTQHVAVVRLK